MCQHEEQPCTVFPTEDRCRLHGIHADRSDESLDPSGPPNWLLPHFTSQQAAIFKRFNRQPAMTSPWEGSRRKSFCKTESAAACYRLVTRNRELSLNG